MFTVNAIISVGLTIAMAAPSLMAGPVLGAPQAGSVLRVVAVSNLFSIITFPSGGHASAGNAIQTAIYPLNDRWARTDGVDGWLLAGASFMSPAYASLISSYRRLHYAHVRPRHVDIAFPSPPGYPITTFGFQMMSRKRGSIADGQVVRPATGEITGVAALGIFTRAHQACPPGRHLTAPRPAFSSCAVVDTISGRGLGGKRFCVAGVR